MLKMIKFLLAISIGMLSMTTATLMMTNVAFANDMNVSEPVYINGGVGQEESDEFRTKAHDYNLRLYFSEGKTGHSITDVPVTITDKRGNVLLDIASGGPLLFLQMEKGTYNITAQHNGVTIKKTIKVINHKGENIYLNWKSAEIEESMPDEK